MEELCHMGDVVLADPQGKQLLVAGVRLNQAFHDALDIETFEYGVARAQLDSQGGTTSQP